MTMAERLHQWNIRYDGLPREWRFQFVLWPLLILGAINILLTVSMRFPFALLVVLGIAFITAVRVPYTLSRASAVGGVPSDEAGHPGFQIAGADWMIDLNRRYEAMSESRRFWVFPAVLLIAGAVNMMLTIGSGFPFGLLFLLALLALVFVRAPYAAGWLKPSTPENAVAHDAIADMRYNAEIEHAPTMTPHSTPHDVSTAVMSEPPAEMPAAYPHADGSPPSPHGTSAAEPHA